MDVFSTGLGAVLGAVFGAAFGVILSAVLGAISGAALGMISAQLRRAEMARLPTAKIANKSGAKNTKNAIPP